ncbi:MAG: acVLRF1 family peptidyl-tRNA hydrolase [Nocardioides sp.]
MSRTVLVPVDRVERWFHNFAERHGARALDLVEGRLRARAEDGSVAQAALPLGRPYAGAAEVAAFTEVAREPMRWGVLLVRKGGFAVATVDGATVATSKVGQRHVQGRTKAGGQSQQRFARRRDNQARQAYEAAADHAHRILVQETAPVQALVCGGDRTAVEQVLADPRLRHLDPLRVAPWLAVPDPRRAVLDQAVRDGVSVSVEITDPVPTGS